MNHPLPWLLPESSAPDLVDILVGDTGPGIPPEDQGRIFERHYRGLQAAGDLRQWPRAGDRR